MKFIENSSTYAKILYLFIFCLVGLLFAGTLVTLLNVLWSDELLLSAWGIRISSGIQMVFMFFLPTVSLMFWSGSNPTFLLGLNDLSKRTLELSLLGIAILLLGMPLINLLTQVNLLLNLPDSLSAIEVWMKNLEESAQATTTLLLDEATIWAFLGNLLFIGVFAAVAEEFFFRGALQNLLVKMCKNSHIGVWLTAFIFSFMHMQFYGFLPRLILGVILGYLFIYSNNLWIPILIHFLNNALVVAVSFFSPEGSMFQDLQDASISVSSIILGIVSAFFLIFLFRVYRLKALKEVEEDSVIIN